MRVIVAAAVCALAAVAAGGETSGRGGVITYTAPDGTRRVVNIVSTVPVTSHVVPSGNADRRNELLPMVRAAAAAHGLDPDLVDLVIRMESGYQPGALSPKGAQGLMQLMPATASQYGVRNAFDPTENIRGGIRYLRDLLTRFGSDLKLALAAYNAGPEAVARHNGVPPYRETRTYVDTILSAYGNGANLPLLRGGFGRGTEVDPVRSVSLGRRGSELLISNAPPATEGLQRRLALR